MLAVQNARDLRLNKVHVRHCSLAYVAIESRGTAAPG
jgi:hypothetical protein